MTIYQKMSCAKGFDMQNTYENQKEEMLKAIEYEVSMTAKHTGISRLSTKILQALKTVPRHMFISITCSDKAYLNEPIAIGYGQTTSQPFIIAIMIELLDITYGDKILEVGTGSGYQTAILSKLSNKIYTVELIPQLFAEAMKKFQKLKIYNVNARVGNGTAGWIENAPFNKIIISAACENIPLVLVEQLASNGIMVLPICKESGIQILTVIKKDLSGNICINEILPVQFVPLVNKYF